MELTFPWWCLFIAYGFCVILVSMSILFIIARGIEFGDLKSQQWLTSIVTGILSSIFLTQPIKIVSLAIFFACCCRNCIDLKEENEYIDDDQIEFDDLNQTDDQKFKVCFCFRIEEVSSSLL